MTLVIFGSLGHVDRYLEKTHRKAALHWPKYVVDAVYAFPEMVAVLGGDCLRWGAPRTRDSSGMAARRKAM
jgi:hypothetical protein